MPRTFWAAASISSSWTKPTTCATARARATNWWTRSTSVSCSCCRRRRCRTISPSSYNVLTLLKPGIFKTLKDFRAAYVTPGKPHQPANPERLRELMRGAMVRNTRAVVPLKLPRRHDMTVRVDGSEDERSAYQELAAAARRLAAKETSRLALHHLLGAAGSSPAAAAATVRRFAGRHADHPNWHA